jgi:hypothetical protein
MLHHKYMIADQYAPNSDPMVFTGSHNWSAAADNDNDENTLIIHDATLANIYYQQFVKRFVDNLGVLVELTTPPTAVDDVAETGISQLINVQVLNNDTIQATVSVTIDQPAIHGSAYIPFGNPNVVSYSPEPGFIGQDSAVYKIAYQAEPTLFATAKIYINVIDNSEIAENAGVMSLNIYPNPAKDEITITLSTAMSGKATLKIFDLLGNQRFKVNLSDIKNQIHVNIANAGLKPGIYNVTLEDKETLRTGRIIICK